MAGEIALKKLYANNASAYIVDDLNEAQRRFFLPKTLIVIPVWQKLLTADGVANLTSDIYELSGRNQFAIEATVVGVMSAGSVQMEASITGNAWTNVTGSTVSLILNNASTFVYWNTSYPYRYVRLKFVNALVGGTSATITLSAIAG
jgi:hypothetical protein